MKVVWSPEARALAGEVVEYIAQDRPGAAREWLLGLGATVARLETHPHTGRRVPEMPGTGHRELIYRGYRIVYRVDEDLVRIVSVWHQRRLLGEDDVQP